VTTTFNELVLAYACDVTDEAFNERVAAGLERFGVGDMMRCVLRSEQWRALKVGFIRITK
jgi:hypothetical protein